MKEARKSVFKPSRLRWALPAITVAFVLALMVPGTQGEPTETREGLTFAAGDLARALDDQLAAEQAPASETRVMLSFADDAGSLCRGFARADLSGIACRRDGGWHLRVQRDGIDIGLSDYRQANSVDAAILTAAQDMAAGQPLSRAEEQAARARGWRPQ